MMSNCVKPLQSRQVDQTDSKPNGLITSSHCTPAIHNDHFLTPGVTASETKFSLTTTPDIPFMHNGLLSLSSGMCDVGNNLAKDRVVVNPVVTNKPYVEQPPGPVEQAIPGLYLACAVTRLMSKKYSSEGNAEDDTSNEINLSNAFSKQIFKNNCPEVLSECEA